MTALLERAIQETQRLSPDRQDWLAEQLLLLIEDENAWDQRFAETGDVLGLMAAEAAREYHAGHARKINLA